MARLATQQHGVVALRQLTDLGLSSSAVRMRVAAGRLHRVHRGVYAVGHSLLTVRGRWMAAVLACGPGAVLSHRSAAALWGVRHSARAKIDISVPSRSPRSRPGIDAHRSPSLTAADVTARHSIPVTTLSRTLLDLAEVVPTIQLQRAYEHAQRRNVLDVRAIERLLACSNGRRGVGAVSALLAYDPTPAAETRSELERLFLDLVRRAGLPTPSVNTLVAGFEVDACWPSARLVVELDGYSYHRGRGAFERDHARLGRLRLAGYDVLPLSYRQVTEEPEWVVGAVRSLLERVGRGVSL